MLKEREVISADRETVWLRFETVARFQEWNDKWLEVADRVGGAEAPWARGETFTVRQAMTRRAIESRVEVTALETAQRLELRYTFDRPSPGQPGGRAGVPERGTVLESWRLEPTRGGRATTVVHLVDLRRAGLPLWGRLLVELIHRFGSPPPGTEPMLVTLRRLAEGVEDESERR